MGAQLSSCADGLVFFSRPKGQVTLKYFPITGRAEPIRLALMLGGFDYHDQRITHHEWDEKLKKSMPYGQLPVLVAEGKTIAQTKAILRYVGKLSTVNGKHLYPQDPMIAAQVDELVDVFEEIWMGLSPTFQVKDQQQKVQIRQRLFASGGECAKFVDIFERALSNSANGYAVPEAGFSVADLVMFCCLNTVRSGFIEGLGPDLFKEYTHIKKHIEKIAELPQIKAYYSDKGKSNPLSVPFYEVFQPGG